jgi:ubiquinol-cytochrome c reductase cytochrome b/c1 subunit
LISGSFEEAAMAGHSNYVPQSAAAKWLESRLPVISLVRGSFVDFPTPKNLNYWWTFGGILFFVLIAQILTGIVLVMHYTASVTRPSTPSSTSCAT